MAQIQIATGREGAAAGPAGQPALQAGVWGQNQQPAAASGRALQAAVKRPFSKLFWALAVSGGEQGVMAEGAGLGAV